MDATKEFSRNFAFAFAAFPGRLSFLRIFGLLTLQSRCQGQKDMGGVDRSRSPGAGECAGGPRPDAMHLSWLRLETFICVRANFDELVQQCGVYCEENLVSHGTFWYFQVKGQGILINILNGPTF